jgi:hypothetical protein
MISSLGNLLGNNATRGVHDSGRVRNDTTPSRKSTRPSRSLLSTTHEHCQFERVPSDNDSNADAGSAPPRDGGCSRAKHHIMPTSKTWEQKRLKGKAARDTLCSFHRIARLAVVRQKKIVPRPATSRMSPTSWNQHLFKTSFAEQETAGQVGERQKELQDAF